MSGVAAAETLYDLGAKNIIVVEGSDEYVSSPSVSPNTGMGGPIVGNLLALSTDLAMGKLNFYMNQKYFEQQALKVPIFSY